MQMFAEGYKWDRHHDFEFKAVKSYIYAWALKISTNEVKLIYITKERIAKGKIVPDVFATHVLNAKWLEIKFNDSNIKAPLILREGDNKYEVFTHAVNMWLAQQILLGGEFHESIDVAGDFIAKSG